MIASYQVEAGAIRGGYDIVIAVLTIGVNIAGYAEILNRPV